MLNVPSRSLSPDSSPPSSLAPLSLLSALLPTHQLEATLPFLPSTSYFLPLFYVHATLEIHAAGDVLHDVLDDLETVFGRESETLKGFRALVHYHVRGAPSSLPFSSSPFSLQGRKGTDEFGKTSRI